MNLLIMLIITLFILIAITVIWIWLYKKDKNLWYVKFAGINIITIICLIYGIIELII